jgi:hypothetical protein
VSFVRTRLCPAVRASRKRGQMVVNGPALLASARSPPGAEARAWVGIGPERTRW